MDLLKHLTSAAEHAELAQFESASTLLEFKASALNSCQVKKQRCTTARVIRSGRLGFAATTADLSDASAAKQFAGSVLAVADFGGTATLRFPRLDGAEEAGIDAKIAEMSTADLRDLGRALIAELGPAEPGTQIDLSLTRDVHRFTLANSAGGRVARERSPLACQIICRHVDGDDILAQYDVYRSERWDDGFHETARRVAERRRRTRCVAPIKPGAMPVLFAPWATSALLDPVLFALNGANAQAGNSLLADRLGESVFDAKLTLVDDPIAPGRHASTAFDDEGIPRRRTVFVESGVPRSFFHSLDSAARAGAAPTGHGFRENAGQAPAPEAGNLIVQPGDSSLAEMLASMKRGLYVEQLLGTGFSNTAAGEFSTPIQLGYAVENGELVGRVKDTAIAGNVFELLRDIADLSREAHWVWDWSLPFVLLPAVNVASKG